MTARHIISKQTRLIQHKSDNHIKQYISMNKKELTNAVAAKTGLNRTESRKALDAVIETVTEELKRNG